MKYLIAAALLVSACTTATAQPSYEMAGPGVYDVINVDPRDVLNIRETPSPASAIVGSFSPDARRVEVLEVREGWGRVLAGEGNGWVSMRYLLSTGYPELAEFDAPAGLVCTGTEPFWGLELNSDGSARFNDGQSYGEWMSGTISDARAASARPDIYSYHFAGGFTGFAVIDRQSCSDGMSGRDYGWRAYADIRDAENGARLVTGCCRVPLGE